MTIVVTINIYKSIKTLKYQLENIKKHLDVSYVVILNCNKYMYDVLLQTELEDNIYINPEIIEKERYTGTLTKGIVSNMTYALKNFSFKYFLVLSGRTIFYRNITEEQFDNYFRTKKWSSIEEMETHRCGDFPFIDWKWISLKKTKLAKYYMQQNYKLICDLHEGVCFSYNVTKNILHFLENNLEITSDLYSFGDCVEEFALHTIASNEYDKNNLEYGFVYIGNGSSETCDYDNIDKYTRKIPFLD